MHAAARLILAFMLVALPSCVVPVGPDWSDPATNDPPTIQSAVPPVGSQLAADPASSGTLMVTVGLADLNTADRLYLRWLIDYPPFDPALSRNFPFVLAPDGKVLRSKASFAPSCAEDQIASGFASHRLMLAVSDRPFLDESDQGALDAVPSGNYLVEAVWPFRLDCP